MGVAFGHLLAVFWYLRFRMVKCSAQPVHMINVGLVLCCIIFVILWRQQKSAG